MAPEAHASGPDIEAQLKDIVQNLYNLIVQAYDHQGAPTQDAMKREITSLIQNLVKLSRDASAVTLRIPPEVVNYVELSRNPDIFTREFVEMVQRLNQKLKGRSDAFRLLRDSLAKDIVATIPELKDDVIKVLDTTGDSLPT